MAVLILFRNIFLMIAHYFTVCFCDYLVNHMDLWWLMVLILDLFFWGEYLDKLDDQDCVRSIVPISVENRKDSISCPDGSANTKQAGRGWLLLETKHRSTSTEKSERASVEKSNEWQCQLSEGWASAFEADWMSAEILR